MKKILPLARHTVLAAATALLTQGVNAQTSPPGRTAFDQSGCRTCHAYSSRRGAPSVRDMLSAFEGEPEKALKSIQQSEKHVAESVITGVSPQDVRSISEWISGASLADDDTAPATLGAPDAAPASTGAAAPIAVPVLTAPAPTAPPAVMAATPLTQSPVVSPPVVAAPVIAATISPKVASPIATANVGSVTGITIEAGAKSDRLIISLSGREPDGLDMTTVDGKLVITLPGISRAANVAETIAAAKTSRAVGAVRSTEDKGTLTLTVVARKGELQYSATQARNRLLIDLTAVPSKKKAASAAVALAPVPIPAPVFAPVPAPAATKPTQETKVTPEKTKGAAKPEIEKTPDAKQELAAKAAAAEARAKLEAKTKADAEAKAKKDAEAQALAKKEQETKQTQAKAKKDADDKQKTEVSAASKAENDMLAALKASAEALKGGATGAAVAGADGDSKSGRRDRSKMKAPEKFRDEPCPPLANSDPVGNVDESRAKDIIERVGCPQCHAFVQKKTGPPFKRVFEKVKGNPSCVIQKLKKNKEHNEEGVTDDLKGPEFKIVADYLATRAK